MSLIRVGIFFGGPSREREISFAGGRTVYDNLNKSLFEPIPIFMDSHKRLIKLNWQYIYKGTIRDFYPPINHIPKTKNQFQIYIESLGKLSDEAYDQLIQEVGTPLNYAELNQEIDLAFLALHGVYGEDGQLQGILESMRIPYTGSDIFSCAVGMNKALQKDLMRHGRFTVPAFEVIKKHEWTSENKSYFYDKIRNNVGSSVVIRPANQGSSIGVSISHNIDQTTFENLVDNAFFRQIIRSDDWLNLNDEQKVQEVRRLSDLRDGLGFPMRHKSSIFFHPEQLLSHLDLTFVNGEKSIELISIHSEQEVIAEAFIEGKEFSCIVIRKEDGSSIALPPTEIVKGTEVFDYRSKYMPGLSRKVTPIDLPDESIRAIQSECEKLFEFLRFKVYARIDGFIQEDGTIILNDPNTTSGMLPSSFFFHQAAEIGLNPSQFLTFIIRMSIQERVQNSLDMPEAFKLLRVLDEQMTALKQASETKKKTAVILGGYSFERHISVESGRNIYEKLASSTKYSPVPIFLMREGSDHSLWKLPINLLLKDNADDIRDKILHYKIHPVVEEIKNKCVDITSKYSDQNHLGYPKRITYQELAEEFDMAFIALHGRPGEDGTVQSRLKELKIPYNGSDQNSACITIDKFETLQKLKTHGFEVTEQYLAKKEDYLTDADAFLEYIEKKFKYPFIAKPVDDGCSSAVAKIKTRSELTSYINLMFRDDPENVLSEDRKSLGISDKDEFPAKSTILFEALINAKGAPHFMEITGGLITHKEGDKIKYELFEPSEALATDDILSLEEKFLAGEGQNLTPARFGTLTGDYKSIADQVKNTLQSAAEILDVKGYARIDAFVRIWPDNKVETIIIEINSLPGMTPATCIFHQCAINGYKPYQFIDKILEFGAAELEEA